MHEIPLNNIQLLHYKGQLVVAECRAKSQHSTYYPLENVAMVKYLGETFNNI
jgi:hypothetical protein